MGEPRLFAFSAKGLAAVQAAVGEALARAQLEISSTPSEGGQKITVAMEVDYSGSRGALDLLGPGHVAVLVPNEETPP